MTLCPLNLVGGSEISGCSPDVCSARGAAFHVGSRFLLLSYCPVLYGAARGAGIGGMDGHVDPAASQGIARSRDRLGRAGFTRESADIRQFEVSQATGLPSAASPLQVGVRAPYREGVCRESVLWLLAVRLRPVPSPLQGLSRDSAKRLRFVPGIVYVDGTCGLFSLQGPNHVGRPPETAGTVPTPRPWSQCTCPPTDGSAVVISQTIRELGRRIGLASSADLGH